MGHGEDDCDGEDHHAAGDGAGPGGGADGDTPDGLDALRALCAAAWAVGADGLAHPRVVADGPEARAALADLGLDSAG